MKVYLSYIHAEWKFYDSWNENNIFIGVFSTKEKALTEAKEEMKHMLLSKISDDGLKCNLDDELYTVFVDECTIDETVIKHE